MKKILFINDTSKSKNLGCQATMYCINHLLSEFKDYNIKRFPLEYTNSKWLKKTPRKLPTLIWTMDMTYNEWLEDSNKNKDLLTSKILKMINNCDIILCKLHF